MLRNTVIVDGSNIATEGRSTPSLRQLDEAVRAFIEDHPTDNLVVIVDATFGHRIDESERPEFEEAILAGELITPPAGTIGRGDAFIIQIADKADATVLSNDSFQELHAQYPWLFDEGRLIGGKPVPGLGWVFILRTPVRGPVSRRVTREAKSGSQHDKNGSQSRDSHGRKAKKTDKTKGPQRDVTAQKQTPVRAGSGGADKKLPDTPINDAVPFFDFVGAHPVGSRVTGKITEFSSHGAYADVEGVRCYVPLRLMGDPAPRSAKEVVKMGEERQFVLFALDPPRRGVDLALVAAPQATPSATSEAPGSEKSSASTTAPPKARAKATARSGAETSDIDAPADASDVVNEPAAKKAATKKAAATKSAATKKSAAKKVATTKAPTKKVAAKKSATTKAPTKKVAGTKVASKTVANEKPTPATKASATTKVATKKAPAKKPATKKAAATKATPTKAVAKKAAGKAAPAKKAATKTATAKKATAKKAPAKSTPAKKSPAKKSPAKKTTTKKTNKNENVAG